MINWDDRALCAALHAVFSRRWSKDQCRKVHEKQCKLISTFLPDLENKVILDLGCGIGRLSEVLAKKASKVIGLDISFEMIKRAKEEVNKASIEFIHASAVSIPFSERCFDIIISSFVLQHILDDTDFEQALNEIKKLVRRGGFVLIMDGIGSECYIPSNPNSTIIRTLSQYSDILAPAFNLQIKKEFTCVDDRYTAMLWQKHCNS